MNFGPMEIGLIFLAILLLFGYKRLPDASRSLGRSMRIFKGEMKGMKDDDAPARQDEPRTAVHGELLPPAVTEADPGATGRQVRSPEGGTPSEDAAR